MPFPARLLKRADVIVLQFEIPLETVYHTVRLAKKYGVRTIVNPAPAMPAELKKLAAADYFIPNESEAETITGKPVQSVDEARACAGHLLDEGLSRVILTLGERGALFATREAMELIPAFAVTAKDSTGAGDAFIGSFAVFLAEGFPEREAIRRANLYAGISTTAIGTQKSFIKRARFDREWRARARVA